MPGEDQSKVVYRLVDAKQYRGKHVMVVGGGDSALEAALSLSEESEITVTLSYRGDAFARARSKNRDKIRTAIKKKKIDVYLQSTVKRIGASSVILTTPEGEEGYF